LRTSPDRPSALSQVQARRRFFAVGIVATLPGGGRTGGSSCTSE
jgi:hypothetical protein